MNAGEGFTVINLDAIHSISVNFCACGYGAQSRYIQLLRAGLFPISSELPRAAITFRTLELFELLSYESKVSAYEYYRTLLRLTDNTGMKTPPVRIVYNSWADANISNRIVMPRSAVVCGFGDI